MAEAGPAGKAGSGGSARRLAAILHADVVGYSRLMGEDEVGTHARLMDCRGVVEERVAAHGGRVVGTAGDAMLAEFPSLLDAVAAALEAQRAIETGNRALAEATRLQLRIGINLGEVIVDGDDIFGDGVNVAARIQALADPGGIAVSGAVYDQLRRQRGIVFEDRGTQRLKNVAEPVRVYAVSDASLEPAPAAARRRWGGRRLVLAVAGGLLALALAGGLAVHRLAGPIWPLSAPVESARPDLPAAEPEQMPGRPTIAVLPFADQSGDAERAYFADGVTEDIISELGRFSNLLVLSWSAVAPYKERALPLDELSRDLDVRYVVSGTIRQAGERLRVSVQLTDALRGVLLWSERYDERLADVFVVQDQITRQVVSALAVHVSRAEQARVFEKPTESLGAYDLVLHGRELLHQIERDANFEARAMFEAALAIDPRYADAHVALAATHLNDFMYGWTQWPSRALEQAASHASRAIEIDSQNAQGHALRAETLRFEGDFAAAERAIDRAIELNPNSALSHAIRGNMLVYAGRPDEAASSLELAIRLDPHPLAPWVVNLAQAYYYLGRYEDTLALFDRFGRDFEEDPAPHMVLAAAHGQLGHDAAAARALETVRRLSPFFDPEIFASNLADPAHRRQLLEGLRKAGWE